jgi:hypothetical protein
MLLSMGRDAAWRETGKRSGKKDEENEVIVGRSSRTSRRTGRSSSGTGRRLASGREDIRTATHIKDGEKTVGVMEAGDLHVRGVGSDQRDQRGDWVRA